ncbi:ankyrin repeat domain-containing protein, partial [Legionella drancourtii]|uniref:ankyrin repeat domain-containing protein n=1 Tax=Legionella drancourtii TaxID=168933 RepID=UPI0011D29492
MSTHTIVRKLSVSLGYRNNTTGRCHGFSLRWIEACLLGEEHLFAERINTIVSGAEVLVNSIQTVKEKKGQDLTKEDMTLLDVLAFFESLELYHSPSVHFSLFNASLGQLDIEELSYYASSDGIKSLGGLVRIYSEPGIYAKEEIKEYLDSLGLILESTYTASKEPLGIVLSSNNHTIALTYKPESGWGFMDINQYPSLAFMIHETDLLAERIIESFKSDDSPYSAFNTSVFTTGKHLQLCNLREKLEQFVTSPQLIKEMAGRVANEIGLTYIAASHGHVSVITELEKYGADLNKAAPNKVTPTYIAAKHGHISVIAELAKHERVDLNKANNNGETPVLIAANNGH